MKLTEEVRQKIKLIDSLPDGWFSLFTQVRELVLPEFAEGKRADPAVDEKRDDGLNALYVTARALRVARLLQSAELLLQQAWEEMAQAQRVLRRRIYRATIAFEIAQVHLQSGDHPSAVWWLLHGHADDILGKHATRGGSAKIYLEHVFGLPELAIAALSRLADDCLAEVEKAENWALPAGFCEEAVRRFATTEEYGLDVMQRASGVSERAISRHYLRALLDALPVHEPRNQSNHEIGKSFERVAVYLLLTMAGCVPRPNLLAQDAAFESDVVVRNLTPTPTLTSEIFGRHFLCECKNWATSVGVSSVGYFLFRMRQTHSTFGVIFSANGVTGDDHGEAARSLIRRAFHEDQITCIVITMKDLERLASGDLRSFTRLLSAELELFQFGKQRNRCN